MRTQVETIESIMKKEELNFLRNVELKYILF